MHSHEDGEADHDHDHDDVGGEYDPTTTSLWLQDNITLLSVGIDIGSAGTQVIFSRVQLRRLSEDLTSRYYVVGRETVYQSPVTLTPYLSDERIDDQAIGAIVDDAYAAAEPASRQHRHRRGDPHRRGAAARERAADRRGAGGGGRRVRVRHRRASHGVDARGVRIRLGEGLARRRDSAPQHRHRRRHHQARARRGRHRRPDRGDSPRRTAGRRRRGRPAHAARPGGEAAGRRWPAATGRSGRR